MIKNESIYGWKGWKLFCYSLLNVQYLPPVVPSAEEAP